MQTPEPQEWLILTHELAKKRDDRPSLDWWLEPARTETPRIGLEESLKQLASRFEAIAPEEDKPRLFLLETTVPDGTKYTNLLESDLRSYADLGDDWDDLPDTQGEIKLWIPEDLEKAKLWIPEDLGHLISPQGEPERQRRYCMTYKTKRIRPVNPAASGPATRDAETDLRTINQNHRSENSNVVRRNLRKTPCKITMS